jgi:hypothetical protein
MTWKPEWFYFGCYREAGHYVWGRGMHSFGTHPLNHFDGILAPQDTNEQFIGCLSRLGSLGLTALGFWDNTVDKRPKSNSVIFCPSTIAEPTTILLGAQRYFPEVFARWPGITVRPLWPQQKVPPLQTVRPPNGTC